MKTIVQNNSVNAMTRTPTILKDKWRRQFLTRVHLRSTQCLDKFDQRTCIEVSNN